MEDLKTSLNRDNLLEHEILKLRKLQLEQDGLFIDAAKGAFKRSRANW